MIEFDHVTQQYDDTVALKDLTLTIESHELFVLVGPSGSGKTTLLKMVNRLNEPTSGRVLIDGDDVSDSDLNKLRQRIGYVLQTGALFPNMSVEQNAGIELEILGWKPAQRRERVSSLLERVGLPPEKFCDRMPSELSGGEAQRVGIVRALAAEPLMMLMDEPFSALDPVSRKQLQNLVLELHEELGITVIFVTHDMSEAMLMADRLAVMHEGVLQQCGTPAEVMAAPANDFVRSFFIDRAADSRYLSNIVDAGFGTEIAAAAEHASSNLSTSVTEVSQHDSSMPAMSLELSATDTVVDLAAAFQSHPGEDVRVGTHLLAQSDLIGYLASLSAQRRGEEASL